MTLTSTTRPEGFRLISFACETDADLLPHFVRWFGGWEWSDSTS